ncbi:fatty acid-binding protein, liver-like [Pseudomyrmex gracilis]|uniref:fatty acid-binding protein, liver-like n=1 Tax=Pseudomyrmex gracilis TaxID=219809 RepID=UPI000994EA86|nr:fatty acid-binding protein, liver-like [Pseudomyrmex gracilis]
MVQIAGKYQHVSNNNYEEYIKSLGQQDRASEALKSSPLVEIQKLNDNPEQWKVTVTVSGKTFATTFLFNQPYDEVLPSLPDVTVKSLTTKEGDNFKTVSELGDIQVTRLYKFTDAGMTVDLSSNKSDVKASRTYKRL